MRKIYKTRKKNSDNPCVVLIGDNLDEVNGIAITARSFVRAMRKKNRKVYLIGNAFNTKIPRMEMEKGGIIMLPARCSMDQPGYQHSETAIPRLGIMLSLLKRQPADLIEFETPNTISHMVSMLSKIIGVKTVHHYRTDIPAYGKLLVKNKFGQWLIEFLTKNFCYWSGPIIVPSEFFKKKVQDLGVPAEKIYKLPRGVDLSHFNPDKADNGAWEKHGNPNPGIRLIYVGRISLEKNLPMIVEILPSLLKTHPDFTLTVVGDGPYLEEFKEKFKNEKRITFSGVLRGTQLAGVFAAADLLVFPSYWDTFGNSIIEALASGVPCLVSDQGGPQEIIEDQKSGIVFKSGVPGDFESKLKLLLDNPDLMKNLASNTRKRAMHFTYDESIDRFWEFFKKMVKELYK